MLSNQEILEKTIQKAIDGGWKPFEPKNKQIKGHSWTIDYEGVNFRAEYPRSWSDWYYWPIHTLIFNHDFARALWPGYLGYIPGVHEDDNDVDGYWKLMGAQDKWSQDEGGAAFFKGRLYEYHLQQMVIADDPIGYLEQHI